MDSLYMGGCTLCAETKKQVTRFELSDKVRTKVLERIYKQFNVKADIDPDLFALTLDQLNEAVETGFGAANADFLNELKYNNAVFAAFKTHRQQNDLAALMIDPDGALRPFNDFRKATEAVIGAYNNTWLKTEYDTAVKSARTAARFKGFEKDKDLFPNLKWIPSRAVTPRDAHKPYYNNVRRLSDPWHATHYPGCVYGCQCDVNNTDEPVTHRGDHPVATYAAEALPASPGLDRNPAMTGSIFTDRHPYIAECYPGARKAVTKQMKQWKP